MSAQPASSNLKSRLGLATAQEGPAHSEKSLRVAFIHPDLGIGGAERLVVDAALGLQRRGHDVEILTSHHDPSHCFEPTRDGTLKVRHVKTSIPRSFLGSFHLPLAILQQTSLLIQLLVAFFMFKFPSTIPAGIARFLTTVPPLQGFDVIFIDQLPAIVPALRMLTFTRIVFYCHYPDKEIGNSIAKQKAIARGQKGTGVLRALYRLPLNMFEESATGTADKLLVNSKFTQVQFARSFPRIRRNPRVVYPGIDTEAYSHQAVQKELARLVADEERLQLGTPEKALKACIRAICQDSDHELLLSINRFEAKKNISLAIDTLAAVVRDRAQNGGRKVRLIVAGGYDVRVRDNIDTLAELEAQCRSLKLVTETLFYTPQKNEPPTTAPDPAHLNASHVVFLPSLPGVLLKSLLLNPRNRALLYTPPDEHFGIVPLEAMICGIPVLATNSGGPLESVVDASPELSEDGEKLVLHNKEGTGLLRPPTKDAWASAALTLLEMDEEQRSVMAKVARERVRKTFSLEAMTKGMESALVDTVEMGPVKAEDGLIPVAFSIAMFFLMMGTYIFFVYRAYHKPSPSGLEGLASTLAASGSGAASTLSSALGRATASIASAGSKATKAAAHAVGEL